MKLEQKLGQTRICDVLLAWYSPIKFEAGKSKVENSEREKTDRWSRGSI